MASRGEDIPQCRDGKQVVFDGIHNTILHNKHHHLPGKTWCVARLQDGQVYVFDSSDSHCAEEKMMKKLYEVYDKKRKLPKENMTFYSNYTPCAVCSDYLLEQLSGVLLGVHLTFIAACPYLINRQSCLQNGCGRGCTGNNNGNSNELKKLTFAEKHVTLRAFKMTDWQDLEKLVNEWPCQPCQFDEVAYRNGQRTLVGYRSRWQEDELTEEDINAIRATNA